CRVVEQGYDRLRDSPRIAEGNDDPALFVEQLLRVPIWRRNHRFAQTKSVRKCARSILRLIQIGRDVNVCRADELVEFLVRHETIIKYDVPFQVAGFRQALKTQAIALAVARDKVWMRGAQNYIDHLRMPFMNTRYCLNHVFDAFALTNQAEGQEHSLPFHAELILVEIWVHERQIRNTVRDHVDLLLRN